MNTNELKNTLTSMLMNRFKKHELINVPIYFYTDIINVIIRYYLTVPNYYESDAINTFNTYCEKGILDFNKERLYESKRI